MQLRSAVLKTGVLGLVHAVILWLASGRVEWTRAWIYVALVMGFQIAGTVLVHSSNPELLEERRRIREGTKPWDKVLAPLVGAVGPLAMWITAGLDIRHHWPAPVPVEWSVAAFAVIFVSALLMTWAMTANRFFSATVRIQNERGHRVVDDGPYHYIRHPGYTGALLFTLSVPIALGSYIALVPAIVTALALAVRTMLEDRTLRSELPGYLEYAGRVRSRLIPAVW